ncbi:trigger factor [Sphingomonas sp. HDW15A]|uniref:trigger factor n=1 Tax=Sphingomonas sp. HDW15A TaxID=2714942 RepID=UPI00140DCC4A|nr:trigger factor [Sphingomonas sp. HDW15A]QIK97180.1 trigger factor [Sphingomonas sp. HDW15A]
MLTIPAKDIDARLDQEVKKLAPQIKMAGFRPGKVPPNLIRKMHGDRLHAEALQTAVAQSVQKLLSDNKIRPAMQPEVELADGYAQGKDAEVRVKLETLPDVPKPKIDGLTIERLTVEADETVVASQVEQLAKSQTRFAEAKKGHKAGNGDQVVIDFVGKADGVAFEGGTGTDMPVVLGSGQLIPGFEDQLVGVKAGDEKQIEVTFPADYPAENLKGKPATFEITVKEVKVAGETKIDDEFAKSLGLNDLEQLKGLIRDQVQQELNGLTRTHMKRQLLDKLAADHDFEVPPSMVDAEFNNIMAQLRHEASHEEDPEASLKEIESEAGDYRKIAERRVRLGLLLSEIGAANGVEVSQAEMNRLIGQAASQYQPKDRDRFIQYVQNEPMAAAQLRAPLYEDKVVDFLFSKAEVTERSATREELEADLESEEGHVHGPGCGHDHAAPAKAKKAAKPAKAEKPSAKTATAGKGADAKAEVPKPSKPVKDGAGAKPAAKKADPKAEPAKKPAAKKPAAKKK